MDDLDTLMNLAIEGGDDRVAVLAAYLEKEGTDRRVTSNAVAALGRCGDPAALAPLVAELGRGRHRLVTTTALGDLGDVGAIAPLRAAIAPLVGDPASLDRLADVRARARENADPAELYRIATCATALARLGDDAMAPIAIALAQPDEGDDEYDPGGGVRLEAVQALGALVAPGVADALHQACDDPGSEVSTAAFTATARLGRRSDIERWLALAERNPERVDEVVRVIELVTNETPEADKLADWWAEASSRFEPGVSYWGGEPASPAAFLPALRSGDVGLARFELRARTGLPFILDTLGADPVTPRELERIEAWWAANADKFPPGKLHRWGRTVEPDAVD